MDTKDMKQSLDRMQQLMDVPLTIRAELDQKLMTFRELLDLKIGTVIQLSRATGENIDIYTGDALIGWGEILLIDGNMAVRIADLRDPSLPDGSQARVGRTV